ncbi:transposase [Patescibacteria group bacterium]|nr:transposase [Patescibacteria group bacterium]MBU4481431.1 transposase [Patescibacteria group bacterium]
MRVEPFTVGDFLHVFNRGNRKMITFRDINDKWRFLKILRFFNNEYSPSNPSRQLERNVEVRPQQLPIGEFKWPEWPKTWPPHKPLVKILSYCLRENHFHLLLKEIIKGGISKFMKKLGDGFTLYQNIKYDEVGRIFQGPYKGKTLMSDVKILQYLDAYIQVLNIFEEYPGGIEMALKEFDKAFEFALNNPFCSLGESFGKRNLRIIDRDILGKMFPSLEIYKKFAYDALLVRNIREILGKLTIE